MKKRDALRLKPGDSIVFGDHRLSAKWFQTWLGEVLHVTPQGKIKVRVEEGPKTVGGWYDWSGPGTGADAGKVRWVPYHHAVRSH